MALGVLCGNLFPEHYLFFKPIATIYTNLVKMIVVPTIFFAILYGLTNIGDISALGRIGIKASAIYATTTLLAVTIGIAVVSLSKPGVGATLLTMLKVP